MGPAAEPFTVTAASGVPLKGWVDFPKTVFPRPAVVLCHGFKGFMEWGFFPPLAELLATRGFVAVRFNFRSSGMRPGEDRVGDPDRFRAGTISGDLEDLEAVLGALGAEIGGRRVEASRIGLLGHSRGGGAALLAASHTGFGERIGALITWASVARFDRFDDATRGAWRRSGELPVVNSRTGQELALGVPFLDDLERHRGALDLATASARRRAPWLIVHGDDDESVPASESDELFAWAAEPRALLRIPGTGHTFGARHPFSHPTPSLIQAMNATQVWLRRHLDGT